MEISWPRRSGEIVTGRIESQVEWIVAALGPDQAARFLLFFGGGFLTRVDRPQARGRLTQEFGEGAVKSLAESWPGDAPVMRVPLGNKFLARYLRSKGHSVSAIARKIRATDTTVRELIRPEEDRRERARRVGDKFRENTTGNAPVPARKTIGSRMP